MTQLSANELTIVRSTNQAVDLFLGIYEPPIVFEAIITGSYDKGDTVISYSTVITGSYTNVVAGMTCYIGTESNGDDMGKVRVRSISSGTITLAIDKSIDYSQDLYITVRDFHEIWPVFPLATVSDLNVITYYKDYDVLYSDQNTNLMPIPIMGADYFGFFDYGTIDFVSTGSYCVDNSVSIDSYEWEFPTGCVPSYVVSSGTALNVQFPMPGFYTVKCTVNGSNGKSSVGYRHVALYNREGSNNLLPIMDWQLKDISGDWEGGWTAKIEVGEGADKFKDGYLVGIWADDYYNGVRQSFGNDYGREHILFMGYVNSAETQYDAITSITTFFIKGTVSHLQNKEMFSVSLEHSASPSDWTQLKNMTIPKILDHYLRWHTTLFEVKDFINIKTEHADYPEQFEDITKGEILNNINNLLSARLFANLSSDKQGRCIVEVDLNMLPTGTRPASVMMFDDEDWINRPKIDELMDIPVSNVLLGGVSYTFGEITSSAYLSRAPGTFPAYRGKSENLSGLTIADQDEINVLSGLYFAKINNRIKGFTQDLGINIRSVDIIPQEFYNRNLSINDTFRKLEWINKRFIPRQISYTHENGALVSKISFEAESHGTPGETIIIPTTPPQTSRPKRVYTRSRPPQQPGTSAIIPGNGNTVYVLTEDKIVRTRNFSASSPTWQDITGTVNVGNPLQDLILDPWNPRNRAWVVGYYGVWKTTNLDATNPTWVQVLTRTQINSLTGYTMDASYDYVWRVHANITAENLIFIRLTAGGQSIIGHTHDYGSTWFWHASNIAVGNEQWYDNLDISDHNANVVIYGRQTSNTPYVMISTDGGHTFTAKQLDTTSAMGTVDVHIPYMDNTNDQVMYAWTNGVGGISKLFKTTNQGDSWTEIQPSDRINQPYPFGVHSYTQNRQIMFLGNGNNADGDTRFYFSTDGGSNWTLRSTLGYSYNAFGGFPYNNGRVYCLRSADMTVLQMGTVPCIRTSEDGGYNWLNKNGNWSTAIGAFNTGKMIVPLWIE